MIIDGKIVAQDIIERLKEEQKGSAESLAAGENQAASKKFFAAILVGDDPASINFLKQKENVARELGVEFRLHTLPIDSTTDTLVAEIAKLAGSQDCGALIVQLPLPETIDRDSVLNAIPKEKDVDCLSEAALKDFYAGHGLVMPPSVATVKEFLMLAESTLSELKVVVIGQGVLIGKPVSSWLQGRVKVLVVFDITTSDIRTKLGDADVIITGTGRANLFSAADLKGGTIVIDFGFSRVDGKITGDFDASNSAHADPKKTFYTPTPGGTGPVLVAKLFENFFILNA